MKLLSFTRSPMTCDGAIRHREDYRRTMSDAEMITTSLAASLFFSGNHQLAGNYRKEHGLIANMLSKSRFNRRLHAIAELMYDIGQQLGMILKQISSSTEYLLDSFPIPVCDNIRIWSCRLLQSEDYRGYMASKKRYFVRSESTSAQYQRRDSCGVGICPGRS